ncbi:collagen alpha-2(I) chain-like [Dipodomys merriami]|uniref:collagen alpha-2(I) chain-like n=1 Tax=Dipodomys merriami TaxID=94247 RepID=UPI003855C555
MDARAAGSSGPPEGEQAGISAPRAPSSTHVPGRPQGRGANSREGARRKRGRGSGRLAPDSPADPSSPLPGHPEPLVLAPAKGSGGHCLQTRDPRNLALEPRAPEPRGEPRRERLCPGRSGVAPGPRTAAPERHWGPGPPPGAWRGPGSGTPSARAQPSPGLGCGGEAAGADPQEVRNLLTAEGWRRVVGFWESGPGTRGTNDFLKAPSPGMGAGGAGTAVAARGAQPRAFPHQRPPGGFHTAERDFSRNDHGRKASLASTRALGTPCCAPRGGCAGAAPHPPGSPSRKGFVSQGAPPPPRSHPPFLLFVPALRQGSAFLCAARPQTPPDPTHRAARGRGFGSRRAGLAGREAEHTGNPPPGAARGRGPLAGPGPPRGPHGRLRGCASALRHAGVAGPGGRELARPRRRPRRPGEASVPGPRRWAARLGRPGDRRLRDYLSNVIFGAASSARRRHALTTAAAGGVDFVRVSFARGPAAGARRPGAAGGCSQAENEMKIARRTPKWSAAEASPPPRPHRPRPGSAARRGARRVPASPGWPGARSGRAARNREDAARSEAASCAARAGEGAGSGLLPIDPRGGRAASRGRTPRGVRVGSARGTSGPEGAGERWGLPRRWTAAGRAQSDRGSACSGAGRGDASGIPRKLGPAVPGQASDTSGAGPGLGATPSLRVRVRGPTPARDDEVVDVVTQSSAGPALGILGPAPRVPSPVPPPPEAVSCVGGGGRGGPHLRARPGGQARGPGAEPARAAPSSRGRAPPGLAGAGASRASEGLARAPDGVPPREGRPERLRAPPSPRTPSPGRRQPAGKGLCT